MSITVEHEKRKREILEKALDVFVDEGYEDTTFQKIAERCGITRTILYLYFKNKREIFSFSIKFFTEKLETEIRAIGADASRSQADKLASVLVMVVDTCASNKRLLSVILDYLGHTRASGGDPDERVRRRTIRMRHILAGIVIEGQRRGEFAKFPVKAAADLFYALVEATIFRIAVLGRQDAAGLEQAAALLATSLVSPEWRRSPSEPKPAAAPAAEPKAPARAKASASEGKRGPARASAGARGAEGRTER